MVFASDSYQSTNQTANKISKLRDKLKEVKQIELDRAKKRDHYDDRRPKQFNSGWILSSQQMQFLTSQPYFYNASAGSYLEMFCLQRFWMFLVRFIPPFVAPCVISAIGLALNLLATIFLLTSSPDFLSDIPTSILCFAALSIFLYQTMDALDGKQAIKVQDSQIEELMDHGCDVISTLGVALSLCAVVKLGSSPGILTAMVLSVLVAFFVVHWTCHVTHTMVFGKIDVSEAQWAIVVTYLLTAALGQQIWETPVLSLFGISAPAATSGLLGRLASVSLNQLSALMVIASSLFTIHTHYQFVIGQQTPLEKLGVAIPRRKNSIYNPAITLLILITLAAMNPSYRSYPLIYCLTYGLSLAKAVINLVLVNVSRGDYEILDSALLGPSLLAVNCALGLVSPLTALLCGLIFCAMDAMRCLTYGFWDLKDALGLCIFVRSAKRSSNHGFYINGKNTAEELARWEQFKTSKLCREVFTYE